ncbi:MAG: hypothetical protein CL610_03945 [Anaerolineaceae bacterium]|nr:hypothetical protein [Anaerolineaceae bacterium]
MTDRNTGSDRRYTGEAVDILYNVKRCIHAEFCVHRAAEVFDTQKRPWINANGASADKIATVIELCPSGALHYDRKDGTGETVPSKNVIKLRHNGPLEIRGDLSIQDTTATMPQETRASLCRCGASNNKPFCDNTHKHIDFAPIERDALAEPTTQAPGPLTITATWNGPLELDGPFEIVNEAGAVLFTGSSAALCRCGGSGNKPFCDGTHHRIGFTAE